jgi:bacterioferritin (cytochrome b1)
MLFSTSLKEAKMQMELPEDLILLDGYRDYLTRTFKNLGPTITSLLTEDIKIELKSIKQSP